jgi:hypothetical protein
MAGTVNTPVVVIMVPTVVCAVLRVGTGRENTHRENQCCQERRQDLSPDAHDRIHP